MSEKTKIEYEPHEPISKIDKLESMLAQYDRMNLALYDETVRDEFIKLLVQELNQYKQESTTRFQEQLKNGGTYNH